MCTINFPETLNVGKKASQLSLVLTTRDTFNSPNLHVGKTILVRYSQYVFWDVGCCGSLILVLILHITVLVSYHFLGLSNVITAVDKLELCCNRRLASVDNRSRLIRDGTCWGAGGVKNSHRFS